MFDHLSLGVRSLARSGAFYDRVLAPLGISKLHDSAGALGYGRNRIGLWFGETASPVPADPSSGLHVCFDPPDRAAVAAFHRAALAHGGTDNGPPGIRADYAPDYYAAFVIDPDGYRLEAYCRDA
ncbi:MAG: VOC family protein [Gammaproteobacteria bacterium]|nr:VOC family protein [Gammaproteobacteria bacterium]